MYNKYTLSKDLAIIFATLFLGSSIYKEYQFVFVTVTLSLALIFTFFMIFLKNIIIINFMSMQEVFSVVTFRLFS